MALYGNGFKVVTPYSMVDPTIKIWLTTGRQIWEAKLTMMMNIFYDPETDKDNLTRDHQSKMPSPKGDSSDEFEIVESTVANFSERHFKISEFSLVKTISNNVAIFKISKMERGLSHVIFGKSEDGQYSCENPQALLLHLYRNIIDMPSLDEVVAPSLAQHIEVHISARSLAILEGRSPEGEEGDVVLAKRALNR